MNDFHSALKTSIINEASGGGKGWTTHYRAKHMPLSPEFGAVINFLGGFSTF